MLVKTRKKLVWPVQAIWIKHVAVVTAVIGGVVKRVLALRAREELIEFVHAWSLLASGSLALLGLKVV